MTYAAKKKKSLVRIFYGREKAEIENEPAICPRMSLSPASGAPTVDASDATNADESAMVNGGRVESDQSLFLGN